MFIPSIAYLKMKTNDKENNMLNILAYNLIINSMQCTRRQTNVRESNVFNISTNIKDISSSISIDIRQNLKNRKYPINL